jgi:hypothetical protein
MSINPNSGVMKAVDLMVQRRELNERIKDTMQTAVYEALQKMHDALEKAGFNTDDIYVDVTPNGLMFQMNGVTDRRLLRVFNNRGAGPSREMVERWCSEHFSQIDPRDFIRRNKFYFAVVDWKKLLLEETRRSDIPVEGECPEFKGDFDYVDDPDTMVINGKRYRIKDYQDIILNGRSYTWYCGGLYHEF